MQLVVISSEDLEKLIERAVKKALSEAGATRGRQEWVPIKATGLPPTTVRKLIKSGVMRAAKIGREIRVSSEDVERYMQVASARKSEPEPADAIEPDDPFERAMARARARQRAG